MVARVCDALLALLPAADAQRRADAKAFALRQAARLAVPLRWGAAALAALFSLEAALSSPARAAERWRRSRLGLRRDFLRLIESLLVVKLLDDDARPSAAPAVRAEGPAGELACAYAVVGSGPGGALTACLLAEAGRDVLLLEEGRSFPPDEPAPFSLAELEAKYRRGGLTVALGAPNVNYVEGRCVGGGSEVNSGLFHRTPAEILEEWKTAYRVDDMSEDSMRPHFEALERELEVAVPAPAPDASRRLAAGAARLGWAAAPARRVGGGGPRRSMTRSYLPRFLAAGGRLLPEARVERLARDGRGWSLRGRRASGAPLRVRAGRVFVACGAVETPALLRRSGIGENVGDSLRLHPTVKVTACFPEDVQPAGASVPALQVKQFAPALSFGCSISSPPYLGLSLLDRPEALARVRGGWRRMAVYYAMTRGTGRGAVRPFLGRGPALAAYRASERDLRELGRGLRELGRLLLEAGAEALYPSIDGAAPVADARGLAALPEALPRGRARLMTIHLFSSCPMGEERSLCAADSFGRVRGHDGLFIADASLLPTAPGVNPQGSIMAVARRNALAHLETAA